MLVEKKKKKAEAKLRRSWPLVGESDGQKLLIALVKHRWDYTLDQA